MISHWMENTRQKLASGSIRFFSTPYLPVGLIWVAVFVAFADLIVILLAQPAGYWITANRAESGLPFLQKLLVAGVGWYILVGFGYLVVLGILLTLLNRSAALAIWLPINFVHLSHSIFWLTGKILRTNPVENSLELILVNAITGFILGIFLITILFRSRKITQPGKLVVWLQRGLPVVGALVLVSLVLFRALGPKSGWQKITPEHSPGQRSAPSLAYDPVRNRAVLFGGYGGWLGSGFMYTNDTWEWDGRDWQEVKPEHNPSPRLGASMAYDEKHGVMVLFGGEDKSGVYMLGDTWLWDGKDWKTAYSENMPPARRGAQLFFDGDTGKLILSGGFIWTNTDTNKTAKLYDDTWTWDGENWQYVTSFEHPFTSTSQTAFYDHARRRTVVFDVNRMLFWEAGSWKTANFTGIPQNRFGPAMAINPKDGRILLFGGLMDDKQTNDTWLLNGDVWQKLEPDLAPNSRDAGAMFYDPIRNSYVLYGGITQYTLDDMWEFVLPEH